MASSDVTYLFFQRDQSDSGGGLDDESRPVIHSTRIIKHGGGIRSRAGSVPPAPLRAGSVPPRSIRAGSVAPRGAVVIATATPSHSLSGTTSSVRHVVHRPPVQTAGSRSVLTNRGTVVNGYSSSQLDGPASHGASLGSGRDLNRRRASITVVTATPSELQQRSRAVRDQMIYRADNFAPSIRNGPSVISSYELSTPLSSAGRSYRTNASNSLLSHRRASVSGVPTAPHKGPLFSTEGSTSYINGISKPQFDLNVRVNDVSDKPINKSSIAVDEYQTDKKESLANLRARMNSAREQMSRHRVLLDRYLPVNFGPSNDVQYEVENKVSELSDRIPGLDPYKRASRSIGNYDEFNVKPVTLVTPYKPLPKITKVDVSPLPPVRSSFTPKISDVRKRARNVLCKVKGDPRYFDL